MIELDYIQYGFAGFAFLLLGIVVWMFKEVSHVVQENTKVITQFVDMAQETRNAVNGNHALLTTIHQLLIRRRCIAEVDD